MEPPAEPVDAPAEMQVSQDIIPKFLTRAEYPPPPPDKSTVTLNFLNCSWKI